VVSLLFLAVPPDLHDDAGFLACNPERDRLIAQLRACVAADSWDAGTAPESAAETAARES
jgi:hypothetical protein